MTRIVTSDVLVIGGGQAGLRAAIEARRQGAKVTIASKGRIGLGGSSAISDTVHSAVLAPGDSAEIFYRDLLRGGKFINKRELALALAADCTMRVQELRAEFHVELQYEDLVTPGHSFPRRCSHKDGQGTAVTRKLREYAERMGIVFYEKTRIVDLLSDRGGTNSGKPLGAGNAAGKTDGNRVYGAMGIVGDEWTLFAAGSTILAAGGSGRVYGHSDNPIDVTGEVLGMAWRHGAELRDLEFVQFYPYRLVDPINMDLYTKLFGKGAVMRNGQGVRFLEKYPRKELETRDVVSFEMFKQGRVYLDISQVSEQDLKETTPRLYSLLAKGYRGKLIMQPVEHYSIGGISIDEFGRTNLAGLYACGECTGGVHGANRLGGGALTEALVFGARAGSVAAAEANDPDGGLVSELVSEYVPSQSAADFSESESEKNQPAEIRKRVQEIMWNRVGIQRTSESLEQATRELSELVEQVRPGAPLFDTVVTAWNIARSAKARRESRGGHQVLDYPGEREEGYGNWIVQGEELSFQRISASFPEEGRI